VLFVVNRVARIIDTTVEHSTILFCELTAVARAHPLFLALDRHLTALKTLGLGGVRVPDLMPCSMRRC